MRIGIHTSIANSLESAALKAHELGANCFQIFSASPRMWRAVPPDSLDIERLNEARRRFDLNPLAALLEAIRCSIFSSGTIAWPMLGYATLASVLVVLIGLFSFKRMERRFADII